MSPQHHLTDELLLDYAAGSAPEPIALIVASHLTYCPHCRARARDMEGIGGSLLATLEPAAVDPGSLERMMSLIEGRSDAPTNAERPPANGPAGSKILPRPLANYVVDDPQALPWRQVLRGVAEYPLTMRGDEAGGLKTALLRIAGGRAIPRHSHYGLEMLLVLDGAFTDETGHFRRGDVQIADENLDHRPIADPERDCVCLTVVEGPIRLTGPFARLLNPFMRGSARGVWR